MSPDTYPPADLGALFADGTAGPPLSVPLPPGRLITPRDGDHPVLWLSDGPTTTGLWASLRAQHASSGLWPLLLDQDEDGDGPWSVGELTIEGCSNPADHDAEAILRAWWNDHTDAAGDGEDGDGDEITEPFGHIWPGLAAPGPPRSFGYAEQIADECAFLIAEESTRIGLVPATRSADTLTAVGWEGPINLVNDVAKISAVIRSWEDRFGVRVIGAGLDTLDLSVAAPPMDLDHALRVAAEHFAFCPDNIWQANPNRQTLTGYAESLTAVNRWSFWWD